MLGASPAQFDSERLAAVDMELAGLSERWQRYLELRCAEEDWKNALSTHERSTTALKREKEQLAAVEAKMVALGFDDASAKDAEAAYERLREECLKLEGHLSNADTAVKSKRESLSRMEELSCKFAESKKEEVREKRSLALHKEVEAALGDMRRLLNNDLKPRLRAYASEMLASLTRDRYCDLTLNEKFEPTIYDGGLPKEVISGGEQDILALAMRLALTRMVQEAADHEISLLILDEIFGSLDPERRSVMLETLGNLQPLYRQILIISHIEEINEAADQTITVHYDASGHCSSVAVSRR
jgi:exonuclease SbcC